MREEIPPRRVVLRNALAAGCGLWVPVLFSGCDAKKSMDAHAGTDAPPAAKKIPQANVQYQAQPKGEQQCSLCLHFIPESNTCKLVDGQINPKGWCMLWVKKT